MLEHVLTGWVSCASAAPKSLHYSDVLCESAVVGKLRGGFLLPSCSQPQGLVKEINCISFGWHNSQLLSKKRSGMS